MELLFCGFPGRLSQLPCAPTPEAGSRGQSFHPCLLHPSWKLSGARTASSSQTSAHLVLLQENPLLPACPRSTMTEPCLQVPSLNSSQKEFH